MMISMLLQMTMMTDDLIMTDHCDNDDDHALADDDDDKCYQESPRLPPMSITGCC